jgi:hypothetical protein
MNILEGTLGLVIAAGAVLLFLLLLLLVWRWLSVRSITRQDPTIPSTGEGMAVQRGTAPPQYDELTLEGLTTQRGFTSLLQTANHNVRIEQVNDRILYTVDGVSYQQLDEIPTTGGLQKLTRRLQEKTISTGYGSPDEELRQVQIGSQTTLEARSPEYTISIQSEGGSPRFIVNGLTYYKLGDIPEPEMQQRARALLEKML